ncbi:ABC transporter ATP-binding protein [Serratia sp. 1D1416]|uniref:ABC transporter ATP-binding protein n=1 Tax=Serratia sp. 1D1416 TaxID=2447890 RepID=UPI001013D1B3|nr:ABC transporter ATP-binding protein [Serratia sp. 1D1416]
MWEVEMENICKDYYLGETRVNALRDVNLSIRKKKFTVLSGLSGSGKTTLLNVIGGIDSIDSGKLFINGQNMAELTDNQLSAFRSRCLGFIFQNFNLIPVLSAYENIEFPLIMQGSPAGYRRRAVLEMLENVGLQSKAGVLPGQLSGGQRQRVAIARALVHRPSLVLADEPTANLDNKTSMSVLRLLRRLQQEYAVTVIFSSHDPQVIAEADNSYIVHDGEVNQQF